MDIYNKKNFLAKLVIVSRLNLYSEVKRLQLNGTDSEQMKGYSEKEQIVNSFLWTFKNTNKKKGYLLQWKGKKTLVCSSCTLVCGVE